MKNEINEIGKGVIDLQIKALKKLKNSINFSFNQAVRAILNCKSKVIICGVGKSGIMHQKYLQLYPLLEHHHFLFLLVIALTVILAELQIKIY